MNKIILYADPNFNEV